MMLLACIEAHTSSLTTRPLTFDMYSRSSLSSIPYPIVSTLRMSSRSNAIRCSSGRRTPFRMVPRRGVNMFECSPTHGPNDVCACSDTPGEVTSEG